MKRILKYTAIGVAAVIALALVGVAGLYAWTNKELKVVVPVAQHDFTAPSDSASIARGEHVTRALAKCTDCHGEDLGGGLIIDDPAIGRIWAPNLTPIPDGRATTASDTDLETAIRHGLAPNGRRLVIMPSQDYQHLSDEDVGVIIAYLRSLERVERTPTKLTVGPVARALFVAGQLPLFPADFVEHRTESVASVPVDSSVAYGKYLGDVGCMGCHGATYSGGKIPGTPPDWPPAANLTPAGIGHYTFATFDRALREGVRPDGSKLHPIMPVQATKLMTDVEMVAMWKYLQSLTPKEFGAR